MFIPDQRIPDTGSRIPDPGSRIPDLIKPTKEKGEQFFFVLSFVAATNITELTKLFNI
jgi:hypothetical protein